MRVHVPFGLIWVVAAPTQKEAHKKHVQYINNKEAKTGQDEPAVFPSLI